MLHNQLNILDGIDLIDLENDFQETGLSTGLSDLSGKKVIFRTDFAKECLSLESLGESTKQIAYQHRFFEEPGHDHCVAAVDSSCILIGETEEGSIFSARVSTVLAREKRILTYFRAGPVIFYVTPKSVRSLLGRAFSSKIANIVLMDKSAAERFIRIQLERTALQRAANKLADAILLTDGALRPSSFESAHNSYCDLETAASTHGNQLVGFSKSSSVKVVTGAASALQSSPKSSTYIDLTEALRALFPIGRRSEGVTVVAKFGHSTPVFRVDFSKKNGEKPSQILSDLKSCDSLFRGYPETLRLAHHLSVFDNSLISSVRSYLSRNFGIVRVPSDDLRATILGKLV